MNNMYNGNGQYQQMECSEQSQMYPQYEQSAHDQSPQMYQQYGQGQSLDYGHQQWDQESQGGYQGSSAAFGGSGYRCPLRYSRWEKAANSRNGLYSPMDQRSGGRNGRGGMGEGYYRTSLPGLGDAEPHSFQPGNTKSPWK